MALYHSQTRCHVINMEELNTQFLMGKRGLVALLDLSSWCLVMVGWLFLTVPWGCLLFVIVVFSDHTHLLFWKYEAWLTFNNLSELFFNVTITLVNLLAHI